MDLRVKQLNRYFIPHPQSLELYYRSFEIKPQSIKHRLQNPPERILTLFARHKAPFTEESKGISQLILIDICVGNYFATLG